MTNQLLNNISDVQHLGQILGFSLTTDDASWILWNATPYPFVDEIEIGTCVVTYLNAVRTNGPFDCMRCGADVDHIFDICDRCLIEMSNE